MELRIFESAQEVAEAAAEMYVNQLTQKPASVLGFATGSTPLLLYRALQKAVKEGRASFADAVTFNLDEYRGLAPEHSQSYRWFMNTNLFSGIDILPDHTHVPAGTGDAGAVCDAYEAAIAAAGGIDLQLLGVGHNGHIGFNEPAEELIAATHVTALTPSTLAANARFFEKAEDVPREAITMGMGTIMKARAIVCLITGKDKHPVAEVLKSGRITTACPASFLIMHPNAVVLCDRDAYYG